VDGVILNGPLPDINPQDIENIEIVKGAAAASLYGSRAAAGVITISTKTGRGGADGVRFNFRTEYGVNDIERDFGISRNHALLMNEDRTRFCVLDGIASGNVCSRTVNYQDEAVRINSVLGDTAGTAPSFPLDPGAVLSGDVLRRAFIANRWPGQNYNAVDQLVISKPLTINNLDVSGRTGNTNFFASVNHTQQGGAIRFLDGYQRTSGRLNVGQLIGDQWDIRFNSFYSRSTQDGFNQEEGGQGFFRLTRTPPIVNLTARDEFGRLFIRPNLQSGGVQNENALYTFENVQREDVRDRFLGGLDAKFTPLDWLDFDANASFDRSTLNFRQFQNRGFRTTNTDPTNNNGFLFNGNNNAESYNASLQATARRQLFTDMHARFNVRSLFEQQDLDFRNLQGRTLAVFDVDAAPNITTQTVLNSSRQSRRQLSFAGGVFLDYKDRYTFDGLIRRDGSSLFGSENRWQTYGRASGAWLAAREPWWFTDKISQFTLRASTGSAGLIPAFAAQYETFTIGAGGTLNPLTLGNKKLRPEVRVENEVGLDLEFFNRVGFTATYAQSDSRNQILPVPIPGGTGFQRQWQNAGTLQNKTLELSLTTPFVQREDFTWNGRINYSRNRAVVTKLNVAPFFIGTDQQGTAQLIRIAEGERYGNIYGRKFITSCSDLPAQYASRCGSGLDFQRNDEGYVVFVGEGNNPGMGITDNLWETSTNIEWGRNFLDQPINVVANWGMPIILRDSTGTGRVVSLGNTLPDYQLSLSQNITIKRLTLFALLDGSFGQRVWNEGRHWSYLDFLSKDVDQAGKSVEAAKPLGYYYRAPRPDNNAGVGGFYDLLAPNSRFVEDASYAKLREVTVSYHVGPVAKVGDWTVSVIGRNLKTFTDYKGFDPEVGVSQVNTNPAVANANPSVFNVDQAGSGAINGVDAFTFPNLRTFTLSLNTSF
jgi:TonB-linked SusC/RagA family outer membrane protein